MALLPPFYMDAVVAIGVLLPNGNKHWIGTGFIVGRKEDDNKDLSTFYMITNKHVIEKQQEVLFRFNSLSENTPHDYQVPLYDNGIPGFTLHPDDKVDIVAIQLLPMTLIKDQSAWGAFDLEDNTLTLQEMQETGVEEGSLVYALGFPMNLVEDIKTPICRLGCISRIKNAFIEKSNKTTFLVDAEVFPGNSGGPIINRPEIISLDGTPVNNRASLIGILSAYIPYKNILISQQTGEAQMVQTENSGLTVVYPVDRIKEVVELEYKRTLKFRNK